MPNNHAAISSFWCGRDAARKGVQRLSISAGTGSGSGQKSAPSGAGITSDA